MKLGNKQTGKVLASTAIKAMLKKLITLQIQVNKKLPEHKMTRAVN